MVSGKPSKGVSDKRKSIICKERSRDWNAETEWRMDIRIL